MPIPVWTYQPQSIQIDTTNSKCVLNCVVCNPQGDFIKKHGNLPMKTIKAIFEEIKNSKLKKRLAIFPFMNTDPLNEIRLPEITKIAKKTLKDLNPFVMISTHGAIKARSYLLRDLNLDKISFTICGFNSETYQMYHGKDLFQDAVSCLFMMDKYRSEHLSLQLQVRYILIPQNVKFLNSWKSYFRNFNQEIWAFHYSKDRKISKKFSDESKIIQEYRNKRIKYFQKNQYPCNCFSGLAIGYDGSVMQCCDLPYYYNWGKVGEVDLMEVWKKRLDLGLNHPGCKTCSFKNPNWKELFEKYVW